MTEKLFGRRPIIEALKSDKQKILKIYISQGTKGAALVEIIKLANAKNIPVENIDRNNLDRQSGVINHQGVAADIIYAKRYIDIYDVLKQIKEKKEIPFLIILDEIQDPRNLGAILRTSCAAGVNAVIIPKYHAAEITDSVIKTSAGAYFHIPVCKVVNIAQSIDLLKKEGIRIIGTDSSGKSSYDAIDYKQPVALVFGAEGKGMRRLTREKCDDVIFVPMKGKISSLNVSVASAIVIYEVLRQRK